MKPTYWDAYISGYDQDEFSAPLKSSRGEEAFVNGVIKLTDGQNIRLWDINTQNFIGNEGYEDATYYEEGYIGVKKNGKWAFMDRNGKMVSDYIFSDVSAVKDGKAYVTYNGKVGILDLKASMTKAGLSY